MIAPDREFAGRRRGWFRPAWLAFGVLCLVASPRRPAIGLSYGLLAIPTFMAMLILSTAFGVNFIQEWVYSDGTVISTVSMAAIALTMGLMPSTRSRSVTLA